MGDLDLCGIAVYFVHSNRPAVYLSRQRELVALAGRIEAECGIVLPVVSGGSSNVFGSLTVSGEHVPGVNQLRIGTAILLGISSSVGPRRIEGFHHDTFVLEAELIEVKLRDRAFGILPVGRLDTDPDCLFPVSAGVTVISVTSDHTVVEFTDVPRTPRVGDRVGFHLGYFAMDRLVLSPYVSVSVIPDAEAGQP